jgi:hypothetical protein
MGKLIFPQVESTETTVALNPLNVAAKRADSILLQATQGTHRPGAPKPLLHCTAEATQVQHPEHQPEDMVLNPLRRIYFAVMVQQLFAAVPPVPETDCILVA